MQYIFVYSYQPRRDDRTRNYNRCIFEMEPGLTIDDMIDKVEDHLHTNMSWWCDPKVVNVIPNITPVQITNAFYEKAMQVLAENPIPADLLKRGKRSE